MTSDEATWDRFYRDYYLQTYVPRLEGGHDPEAEALGAVSLAGCPDGGDVLDAPCGQGRHSLVLARAGYRVVGVDRSETMLAEARRRAADAEWPRFMQADYRELPVEDAQFDAVLCLFSSIGYYGPEEDLRAFREFRRVVRPRGALVVETMHRDRLMRIFLPRTWDELPDGSLLLEEREFDYVAGVVRTRHVLVRQDGGRDEFEYLVQPYTAGDLDGMLREAGFEQVELFGGWKREPLSYDTRLVALARP